MKCHVCRLEKSQISNVYVLDNISIIFIIVFERHLELDRLLYLSVNLSICILIDLYIVLERLRSISEQIYWVNRVSCCCVATNAVLSWCISTVSTEMLSLVAWEVALFDECIFVIWFLWMLAWINTKLSLLLSVTLKVP